VGEQTEFVFRHLAVLDIQGNIPPSQCSDDIKEQEPVNHVRPVNALIFIPVYSHHAAPF
jgi:hypothetical protein